MGDLSDRRVGQLMGCVREQAIRLLSEQLGLAVYPSSAARHGGKPALVSSIPIGGPMEGIIFVEAEEETVSDIMHRLIGDDVGDQELPSMLHDTLNELLNVVVGNSTMPLDKAGIRIIVFPPASVRGDSHTGVMDTDENPYCRIETGSGPIVFSFQPGRPAPLASVRAEGEVLRWHE